MTFWGWKLKTRQIKTKQSVNTSPSLQTSPLYSGLLSVQHIGDFQSCRKVYTISFGSWGEVPLSFLKPGYLLFLAEVWSLLYTGLLLGHHHLLETYLLFTLYGVKLFQQMSPHQLRTLSGLLSQTATVFQRIKYDNILWLLLTNYLKKKKVVPPST